jgi:hypothetical protein
MTKGWYLSELAEFLRRSTALAKEAKLTTYRAFIERELEVPKHLARRAHDLYFNHSTRNSHPVRAGSLRTHGGAGRTADSLLPPLPGRRCARPTLPPTIDFTEACRGSVQRRC